MKFNQHNLEMMFLVPSAIRNFREMIKLKSGIDAFPFGHTHKYRQCTFVDIQNYFGRGHNAMYSVNGLDKSHALFIFESPLAYLTLHHKMVTENRLQQADGEISVFRKDPLMMDGSRTVTGYIQVDAQCWLVHMFCRFDKELYPDAPKYFFVYQHRISINEDQDKNFRPCKLIVRLFRMID